MKSFGGWINTLLYCSSDNGNNISLKHVKLHKLTLVGFDGGNYLFIVSSN